MVSKETFTSLHLKLNLPTFPLQEGRSIRMTSPVEFQPYLTFHVVPRKSTSFLVLFLSWPAISVSSVVCREGHHFPVTHRPHCVLGSQHICAAHPILLACSTLELSSLKPKPNLFLKSQSHLPCHPHPSECSPPLLGFRCVLSKSWRAGSSPPAVVLKDLQGQKAQAVLLLQKDMDGKVEADAARKRGCPLESGFELWPGDL